MAQSKTKQQDVINDREAQPKSAEQGSTVADQKILTFSEIQALIESGQEHLIPNNETIPSGVNVSLFRLRLRLRLTS